MMAAQRLLRSVLFAPTDKWKTMEKAASMEVDAIVYDLEDSVAIEKKEVARTHLREFLQNAFYIGQNSNSMLRHPYVTVRVNCPLTTIHGWDDVAMINSLSNFHVVKAVVLPKVRDVASLTAVLSSLTRPLPIWAMIETAQGVVNVEPISLCGSVEAVVFGSNDFTKDIKAKCIEFGRLPLYYSMSKCVVAARAADKAVIDGVFMDLNDLEGFKRDCLLGKSFGFDGKSLIHPNQILLANSVFSPSLEEVNYARRVISAYAKAREDGKSLAVLDGKLIEYLHVQEATATIRSFDDIHRVA